MLNKIMRNKKEPVVVKPFVNVYMENGNIVVSADMPGVNTDSLDVNLDGNYLCIKGVKKRDDIGREYKVLQKEREEVEYEREFELNFDIDRKNIKAEYNNGILNVILQRKEIEAPKRIMINV